jgi:hypothetical protein
MCNTNRPRCRAQFDDDDAVHLVAHETDNRIHLSSVSDALYGREYFRMAQHGPDVRGRHADGIFCRGQHSRLGGVLVAGRATYRLFVPYNLVLFPNPGSPLPVEDVVQALAIECVLGPNDYPDQ